MYNVENLRAGLENPDSLSVVIWVMDSAKGTHSPMRNTQPKYTDSNITSSVYPVRFSNYNLPHASSVSVTLRVN